MEGYHGVLRTTATALYQHCKEDQHVAGCSCHLCQPPVPQPEEVVSPIRELMLALEHLRFACEHGGLSAAAGVGTRVLAKYQYWLPDFQTDAYWEEVKALGPQADVLEGIDEYTVLLLKYSNPGHLHVTYDGPDSEGKYAGRAMVSNGHILYSTDAVFNTSDEAVGHMRKVLDAARAWEQPTNVFNGH